MINFLVGKYIIYQPGQYSRPQVTPSLSHDIELRNCPSWNIAHIPRAGAASGLHRPSGCARYFIRDNSFVRYLEITSVIKAFGPSGPHALITGCYFSYPTVINHSGLRALVVDNRDNDGDNLRSLVSPGWYTIITEHFSMVEILA